ncbi:dihydrodipicolinate synthase family protein [Laedolimicola ammoniilytica]|uniref:Dihydrodipicolinate synthase family protein n=1 Tax=Laedolimicola ammoniilytica TaxID=2981771 RepID=A0ABT2S0D2_9FIRM|nr:dihydrodipicolinate synthase family protein [Laedolimicola ammoniilytica]MCU6698042.1 dihydrodipicolinate synthase family protein [Laedolimicola ammoniilytica]SCI60217.1 Dihydrodipicolinate synthase [uncultured Clostridium sp.]
MKKLYGVITAMTTPFDENGKVDLEAVRDQTNFLIEKGVHCLYPCGTTGEMYSMSPEEREQIAETVVKTAGHRVTVFIHVGAMKQEETIRLAQHAVKIGADGVGVVTPSYFTVNEQAMVKYYQEVCSTLPEDFPVYVYVIPQLAHNDITPETMEKICAVCPNVVGVKYSYADVNRMLQYTRVKSGEFSVVFGPDHMFLPALVSGCDGTVSGCSGPMPELFVEVYEQYLAGNLEAAQEAQKKATELCWLMKCGADMSIFKTILTYRGVNGGHMKKPLLDLSEEEQKKLLSQIKAYL